MYSTVLRSTLAPCMNIHVQALNSQNIVVKPNVFHSVQQQLLLLLARTYSSQETVQLDRAGEYEKMETFLIQ